MRLLHLLLCFAALTVSSRALGQTSYAMIARPTKPVSFPDNRNLLLTVATGAVYVYGGAQASGMEMLKHLEDEKCALSIISMEARLCIVRTLDIQIIKPGSPLYKKAEEAYRLEVAQAIEERKARRERAQESETNETLQQILQELQAQRFRR